MRVGEASSKGQRRRRRGKGKSDREKKAERSAGRAREKRAGSELPATERPTLKTPAGCGAPCCPFADSRSSGLQGRRALTWYCRGAQAGRERPRRRVPGAQPRAGSERAPRLRCRSERPRREQGSETEGAGEGGSACGGARRLRAARERRTQPPTLPGQPGPRAVGAGAAPGARPLGAPGLRGAYRCGAPSGPARSAPAGH